MSRRVKGIRFGVFGAAAFACSFVGAEDLTVSADTTISASAEYENVTFANNATLTVAASDSKAIDFKVTTSWSGTGKIVLNKGRIGTAIDIPATITVEPQGENVEVKTDGTLNVVSENRIFSTSGTKAFNGSLVGTGRVRICYSGSGNGGISLAGDNGDFKGTVVIDGGKKEGSARNTLGAATAGSDMMRLLLNGCTTDNGSLTFSNGTIHFGSVYTEQVSNDGALWRSMNSSGNTFVFGALNHDDDRLTLTLGDDNDKTDPNIVKIGTGRMEIGDTRHRGYTIISNGVLQVAYTNALAKSSYIAFDGGTLAYGTNLYADAHGAVTKDYSGQIRNSHGPIAIDTMGHDVTWVTALDSSNKGGFVKKGEGTLDASSGNAQYTGKTIVSNGTLKIKRVFANGAWPIYEYEKLEGANLEVTMFANGTTMPTPSFGQFPTGTVVNVMNEKRDSMVRVKEVTDFNGTINFYNTYALDGARGFVGATTYGSNDIDWGIVGEPATVCRIFDVESKATINLGELRVTSTNAQINIKSAGDTFNIGALNTYSYLNGQFVTSAATFNKNGTGKLAIGPGFTAVGGSTFNVNAGTLELSKDVSFSSVTNGFASFTIADKVTLCGEGTFGAVDLSQHDLVFPVTKATADKTATYTLLTATSLTGDYTSKVTDDLAALNAGETKGKWKLHRVASGEGDAASVSVQLAYFKNSLSIIVR